MIRFVAFFIVFNLLIGCARKDDSGQQEVKSESLKAADSSEEPAASKSTVSDQAQSDEERGDSVDRQNPSSQDGQGRKLRYLFYANGGLVGYFSDGTVAGCPRCELLEENVKALYTEKPFKNYTVEHDGLLLVNGKERVVPKEKEENGNREWAMIDYKWIVQPK